ncbi:curli production assembly/transport protein CsgE [Castellaniella caeni]|uniref:curli production assembly/transport protein CsgE n=1 Tax=Castellaniella caeni TaxID=266123 RepID=UPI0012ED352B|nr:curli production assembly/transport protein CsgE [Castellaniella caeni]
MRHSRFSVSIIALVLSGGMAAAQEPEAPKAPPPLDQGQIDSDPLQGLILSRTMTVLGWDFYKNFAEVWQALYPDSRDTITVIERPTAQFGSEIWINYLNQAVFHTFLSPARSRAREESKNAVEAVHNNIEAINIQRRYAQDADLGPEEM